jgi:hypothetical protein
MQSHVRRAVGLVAVVLGTASAFVGCGSEEPKPVGAPVELTPGMEQMKKEMMDSMRKTPAGKRVLDGGKPKR